MGSQAASLPTLPNNGGVGASSLNDPVGVVLDSSGNLYVVDDGNSRVLFYPAGSTTATRVYGQNGSFTTKRRTTAASAPTAYVFRQESPWTAAAVSTWPTAGNNRVLFYPAGSTTATRVYGQGGSFTTNTQNNGGVSANSLADPYGVALDGSGDLYVADSVNNRVLFYPSGSTTATRVYGQLGSFTTNSANNGGISANSLDSPFGVTVDGIGNLYIADSLNNRVLFYLSNDGTTAMRVYGQLGSFSTNTANNGGISANSLESPFAAALDNSGNFYVADAVNNRALIYPPTTTPGIYSPVNQSTLGGNSETFWWAETPALPLIRLDVGNAPGGNNYYQSGSLSASIFSQTVNSLPSDGSTVYATWYYLLNGSWVPTGYRYTAFGGGSTKGIITSPVPGSTLTGSSVAFTWTAGSGATAYWIDAGSTAGGSQYYQSGNLGNVLSATVPGLPTNGSMVYITLWSLVNGQWLNNQYTYTAFNVSGSQGVLTTPTPGSMLPGSSVAFGWTAGAGATAYWLDIGNVPGGNQYYQSGNLGNVLTTTTNGLPTDGSTVYATLYSLVGGQWLPNAYTYTAYNPAGALGVMQTPAPGSTLNGNQATFTWSAGSGATAYWLDIGNVAGGNQYYQSGNLGNVLTTTVYSLPANGTEVYVTLYSLVGGQWFSNAYTYTSGPGLPPKVIMSIVLDRSGSMVTDGGETALQSAVPTFVNLFDNSLDEVALLSFSDNATINFPIGYGFITPIDSAVASMQFAGGTFGTGAGNGALLSTTIGAPMSLADAQNNSVQLIQGQSVVKVLVYFTDGLMNTVQDNFYCGPSAPSVLINYGGYDSGTTVSIFDPTSATTIWGTCNNGCPTGFPYDANGDICRNAQGQPVTTFLSQQTGQQTAFSRANVTTESQYRAIYTANAMRTESPVPTYIYTIGLGPNVGSATQAFLAQLANDPSYSTYNPSQPPGAFFYIPDCPSSACTADLTIAFQEIASRLL